MWEAQSRLSHREIIIFLLTNPSSIKKTDSKKEYPQALDGLGIFWSSVFLVLLDLMLPGMTGEEVLRELRTRSNLPVIVLTAKDGLDEKVGLLTGGADDYITKPFEIKEVIARVQIQLRHVGQGADQDILSHRKMVLDKITRQVSISGTDLPNITRQEFAILELLLGHPKQVFSKEDIFEYAWNEPYMGETKTLDVHISNIRKKIKTITEDEYIETVWGIGYRLSPAE